MPKSWPSPTCTYFAFSSPTLFQLPFVCQPLGKDLIKDLKKDLKRTLEDLERNILKTRSDGILAIAVEDLMARCA
jgi:hypothetical protein